jgi:tetratricopeptide (TPR) repeat protein
METTRTRRRVIVDGSPLAAAIGGRIRKARLAAGLTQQQLAGERYTKAYISALENGLAKPSMAALDYLAPRLGSSAASFVADPAPAWLRLEADLALAAGRWSDALDGYEALLEGVTERGARGELQVGIAEALCRLGRFADAIRPATESATAFDAIGRDADGARAQYWLASAHFQADNPVEARSILVALLDRIRAGLLIEPDFTARVLVAAAMVETSMGSTTGALAYLEEARGLRVDLDDRRRGAFFASLATAYRQAGDTEGAIRAGLQAVALLRAAHSDLELARMENQLAMAYLDNGNASRAAELAHGARTAALDRGDEGLAAHLADTEALIALETGDPDAAIELAGEAILLATRSATPKAYLDSLVTRGRAYAALGRHEDAAADFERAAERARETERPSRRREILSAWADTLAALGQHDQAFALAREALAER